jgi:hypothetical protein
VLLLERLLLGGLLGVLLFDELDELGVLLLEELLLLRPGGGGTTGLRGGAHGGAQQFGG